MASGKSTVARRLQQSTSRPVVSLDTMIEARAGRTIAEIFAGEGEVAFRRLELQVLQSEDPDRHLVVDAGGGVVETPAAVELLRKHGVVMWLDTPWEIVRSRLKQNDGPDRPLVERLGWAGLEELYQRRRPLYAAAADFRLAGGPLSADGWARTVMLRSLLFERRREGVRT